MHFPSEENFTDFRQTQQAPLKLLINTRYVDDTFLMCQHGQEALDNFVEDLNNRFESIKFMVEQEHEGNWHFWPS